MSLAYPASDDSGRQQCGASRAFIDAENPDRGASAPRTPTEKVYPTDECPPTRKTFRKSLRGLERRSGLLQLHLLLERGRFEEKNSDEAAQCQSGNETVNRAG